MYWENCQNGKKNVKLNHKIKVAERLFEYVRITLPLKAKHGKIYFKFQFPFGTRYPSEKVLKSCITLL
jgi:hypothetical protein